MKYPNPQIVQFHQTDLDFCTTIEEHYLFLPICSTENASFTKITPEHLSQLQLISYVQDTRKYLDAVESPDTMCVYMWERSPWVIECHSSTFPCMMCQIPANALYRLKGLSEEMTQPRTGYFDHTYRYAGLKNGYPLFR